MSEVGYFFDAVQDANTGNWDKTYTSADFAQLFSAIFTNGVVPAYEDGLAVSTGTTGTLPTVTIAKGAAVINGRVYVNTETVTKTISALADSVLPRIDRIVVELDTVRRTFCIKVLEGTPASTPVAPEVTQGNLLSQLALADVLVIPGESRIIDAPNSDIPGLTDQRYNDTVGGWCSVRLRDIDLSNITQAWYDSLRQVYDPEAEVQTEEGTATSAQLVLSLLSDVSGLKSAVHLAQQNKEVSNRALIALLYPGAPTENESTFARQSLVAREVSFDTVTGEAITKIAANDFDLIAVTLRYSADPDMELARVMNKPAYCYLTQIGTNPHPRVANITDAEIKKRTALEKRANYNDYAKTITVFLRPGDVVEATYYDKWGKIWIARELRWLTEDYADICSGGTYQSATNTAQKVAPSVRFGPVSSVVAGETAMTENDLAFTNAIYFGNARYRSTETDAKKYAGDRQEWTRGTPQAGYFKSNETVFSKNPIKINIDYNQFLIPTAIIGIAFRADAETAARYHPVSL